MVRKLKGKKCSVKQILEDVPLYDPSIYDSHSVMDKLKFNYIDRRSFHEIQKDILRNNGIKTK